MNLYLVDNKNSTKWHAKAKRNQRNDQERKAERQEEENQQEDIKMNTTATKESKKELKVSLKDGTIEASSHNIESANVGWRSTTYQFISRLWTTVSRIWNGGTSDSDSSSHFGLHSQATRLEGKVTTISRQPYGPITLYSVEN